MDMDNELRQYPWSEAILKRKTAEFILKICLLCLEKEEEDISFFYSNLKKKMIRLKSYYSMIFNLNIKEQCSSIQLRSDYYAGQLWKLLFDAVYLVGLLQ